MLSFLSPFSPSSPFDPPTIIYSILSSPLKFTVSHIYHLVLLLRGPSFQLSPRPQRIRLVCIADTHNHKPFSIPPGDVLVHAGDLTNLGTVDEIQEHVDWLNSFEHEEKIVIAGNHDSWCDPRSRRKEDDGKEVNWGNLHYLQHSSITLRFPKHGNRQLEFYGAPQIPACGGDDFAFQYERHEDIWFSAIPQSTDILITHTPPRHHLDLPTGLGCAHLLKEVWRVRPKVHIFGHVHAGYGRENVFWDEGQNAYERVCARPDTGIVNDMIDLAAWVDFARVIWYGILGILWSRLWRGDGTGGLMVNASLMYRDTGRLGNKPQVVEM
jgi:predicted phosphohydrolase